MAGKIDNRTMSIFFDSGSSNSYVAPSVVWNCYLKKINLEVVGLVQLETGTKRKFTKIVIRCPLEMKGLNTLAYLNVITLGSYDVLIGMGWLTTYWSILDCYNKTYTCLDEEWKIVTVKGIHGPIYLRQVTALDYKKCFRIGYHIYASHLEETKEK